MTDPVILDALKKSLNADPRNGALWLHYADLLAGAGRKLEATSALRTACELDSVREAASKRLVPLLREAGEYAEALIRAEALLEKDEDSELRAELERIEAARGGREPVPPLQPAAPPESELENARAEVAPQSTEDDWAAQFDWGDLALSFDDVAGLEEVKRQINLRIIAPFRQPEIYQSFNRDGGGGILLYGPPGCGKTYIARATAGELSARFVSVSIHDVVDQYWGQSEKLIHSLFEDARRNSPTVLFFDEFDALGSTRGRGESQFWKVLVDQILQEMDGIGGRNRDVLLFAATNTPWNVDSAFRRPGRFDRVLFVTPPDEAAREAILRAHLAKLPGGERVDLKRVVRETQLYTGADLKSLSERAAEVALEQSLDSGSVHEIAPADVERALAQSQSTAMEWLSTARNYAKYSNDGGQYDDLVNYLKSIKKW